MHAWGRVPVLVTPIELGLVLVVAMMCLDCILALMCWDCVLAMICWDCVLATLCQQTCSTEPIPGHVIPRHACLILVTPA